MKKYSGFYIRAILISIYAGLISQTAAQGIRNTGAAINISSGYVVCLSGLDNSSGTITNNGIIILNGGNWTNNGTVTTPGIGTVTFNGASEQIINGSSLTTFNNLIIDGTSAGTIIAPGAMVTVSGSTFMPNGKLIIDSDAPENNGSLIYNGSGTPSGNVTFNRILRPEGNYGDRHFFSSPVGGQSVSGFITANSGKINLVGSDYQIWEWNESGGTWPIASAGDFVNGKGYNVDQATGSDGMLIFTGSVVNSASITATSPYKEGYSDRSTPEAYGVNNAGADIWAPDRSWILYGGGGWNLIGNPFTSAMNAAAFIEANSAPLNRFDPNYQALYVYNGTTGQYEYAAAEVPGPIYKESGFFSDNVQAGQGFFVLALYNNVVFNFTSAMQVHNAIVPMLKSASTEEPWPGLELKVKYGNNENFTTIVFNSEMNAGLDPGYDVGQMSSGPDVEIYTSLVLKDNSVNFARQALPLTDHDKNIIPVGIDSEVGGEVIFSAITVPIENYKFWLEDRKTGIFTDLNTNSYTITLPAQTYGTGRFFIYASTNMPKGIDYPGVDNGPDIRIWNSVDRVIIKGNVSDNAICEVFNMQGQKIIETRLAGGELNTLTMPSGSKGIYFVRVIDRTQLIMKKVIIL